MREIGRPQVCFGSGGGGESGGGIGDFLSRVFSGGGEAAPTIGPVTSSVPFDPSGTVPFTQTPGFQTAGSVGGAFPLADTSISADMPLGGTLPAAFSGAKTPATSPVSLSPSTAVQTELGTPGGGVGAAPGPGGGAVASAAPASVDADAAARGIQAGGGLQPQSGFSDTAARNVSLNPNVIGSSAGAGTGTSIDTVLADPSLRNIGKAIGANANILVPAAGLGFAAIQGNKSPEGLDAIRDTAARTNSQSQVLQNYLTTGTLPPGLQAGIDAAKEAARASIMARYANNPGASSAMQQELNQVDLNAAGKAGELAINLFQQGMSEGEISSQLYQAILQQDLERDKELTGAVGNFASAVAGGGPQVNLNFGR